MKRVLFVFGVVFAVPVVVGGAFYAIHNKSFHRRLDDAVYDAQYELDPESYPYHVDCPSNTHSKHAVIRRRSKTGGT